MLKKMAGGAIVAAAVTAFAVGGAATAQNDAATDAPSYTVDPMHSSVVFRIKHNNTSYVYGMFEKMSGTLAVTDGDVPTAVELTIETASVDTNVDPRDKHLRTADFFDVENHPTITFKSLRIVPAEDEGDGMGKYTVVGELTMLGVTKTITAGLDFTGRGEMRGTKRVGIEAAMTVNRSEFGMDYGIEKGTLGDDVTLMVALQGYRK